MGYMKIDAIPEARYLCDTIEDLSTLLPRPNYGDTCWVISEAREYIRNSKGEWLPKDKISAGVDTKVDLTGYATEDFVQEQIQNIEHPTVEVPSKLSELENDVNHVSQDYVDTKIADLVNSAPETLDTIGEIAQALKEHQDVADAITEAIGKKADKEDLPSIEGLASEAFVTEAIQKIEFPVTDLSNYYTKDEVTQAIIDNAELPATDEAHMQLVTNANGETVWENKLAYSQMEEQVFIEEFVWDGTQTSFPMSIIPAKDGERITVYIDDIAYPGVASETNSFNTVIAFDEGVNFPWKGGGKFYVSAPGMDMNLGGMPLAWCVGKMSATIMAEKHYPIRQEYLGINIRANEDRTGVILADSGDLGAAGHYAVSLGGNAEGARSVAAAGKAKGISSFTQGNSPVAYGHYSTAIGDYTVATAQGSIATGRYNIKDVDENYALIVGNGVKGTEYIDGQGWNHSYSNAHTLDWSGNARYAGDVYVQGTDVDNLQDAKKVATEEYVENKYLQKSETYTKSLSFNGEIEGKEVFGDCFYKVSNDTPALEDWAGHTLFFESGTEASIDDMYQGPLNSYPNDGYNINNMIIVFYNDVEGVASKGIYFEWIDYGKVAGANYTAHKTVIPEELLDSDLVRATAFNELADTVKDLNKYCAFMKQGDQIKLGNIQEYSKMYEMLNGANKFHATLAVTYINEEGLLISDTCYAKSVMQAINMNAGGSPYTSFSFETGTGETIRFRWNSDNTISNVSITKNLTEEDINALIEAKIAPAE